MTCPVTSWTHRGHIVCNTLPHTPYRSVTRNIPSGRHTAALPPPSRFPCAIRFRLQSFRLFAEEVCTESPWTFIGHAPAA